MNYQELAHKRYSARKFTEKAVEKEMLDNILEAGRVAPTAANKQPQRLLVVQSKEGLARLAKAARFYQAPTMIIVCVETNATWEREYDGKRTGDIDASIVTDQMMMAATDLGLDTLWLTWFDPQIVRSEFQIPEEYEPVNLLAIGHNGAEPASPSRHEKMRKPLKETVFFEHF
jgi:nitroreductase